MSQWCDGNLNNNDESKNKIEEFLKLNSEYKNLYLKLYCYTYLIICIDNENYEAMNMIDKLDLKNDEFMSRYVVFVNWLKNIEDLEQIIESSESLSEYKFYLNETFLKSKYMLNKDEEQLINKMQKTESRAWERLYIETLTGTNVKIKIDGELKNISFGELKSMAYQKDLSLRRLAFKAEKKACKNIAKTISACINQLSGEAIEICDMKGYESVINKVLLESRMDYETLNTMIKVIEENLFIFHKYYKAKAKILGNGDKINFYDVYALIGTANGKISYGDSQNLIVSSFTKFSDDLGNFAKKAFDEKWIDAEPSSKKK